MILVRYTTLNKSYDIENLHFNTKSFFLQIDASEALVKI